MHFFAIKTILNRLLPQGICLVVCFLCMTVASCTNNLKDLPPDANTVDFENDRAYDVHFIYSQNGKTKAELFTKEFVQNQNAKPPYMEMMKGVKTNFFNDSLRIESVLTAKYARYYPKTGDILVKDSVIVINQHGDKLETSELIWNQDLEKFYTEQHVKITSSGQVSTGEGMEANRDFTWYKIYQQRGAVPVNAGDIPTGE